jgi:hypothetical protein
VYFGPKAIEKIQYIGQIYVFKFLDNTHSDCTTNLALQYRSTGVTGMYHNASVIITELFSANADQPKNIVPHEAVKILALSSIIAIMKKARINIPAMTIGATRVANHSKTFGGGAGVPRTFVKSYFVGKISR